MLSLPTVHLHDNGLGTIEIRIHGRTAECLSPVSGESLDMLWVKTVAERMGDHLVRHHPTGPGVGKAARCVDAPPRAEEISYAPMMTIPPRQYKAIQSRGTARWSIRADCPSGGYP